MKPAGILPEAASARLKSPESPASTVNAPHHDASASPTARIALLGASGYAGQEFARLALGHPAIQLVALVSRDAGGVPADRLLPGVWADGQAGALPPVLDVGGLPGLIESGRCDTIVTSLPHGAWGPLAAGLGAATSSAGGIGATSAAGAAAAGAAAVSCLSGCRIIDLSADHRDGSAGYVYGLPEAFRGEIAGATRIANPGCYPTAFALALLPLAGLGVLDGAVMVSALSGVSGAGRAPTLRTSFVELDGGASFYRVGTVHPHVSEMERTLARVFRTAVPVAFAPQLVPMSRGILLTATASLSRPLSPDEVRGLYEQHYVSEPFVRLLPEGEWPETRVVRGSNRCDLQVTTLHGGTQLLATAAIDNLVKGAAGQALQNLNLMLGLPETTGLPRHGSPW